MKIYIKKGVESFLFNGADLMWAGVLKLSRNEFKQNEVVEVLAKNSLVLKQIEKMQRLEESKDMPSDDHDEEEKDD